MSRPLLLAGPIVRRVEPTLVAVWLALRDPATVTLKLWEGRVTAGSGNVLRSSEPPGARSLRVGDGLHIALAVIKIPKNLALQPGRTYSYDVEIKTATQTETLKTLNLLTTGQVLGKSVEALGYEENFLPSFALPPAEITDLRVVFGSCRRPANTHLDAMVWIDDLMRDNAAYSFRDPLKRPHQLFLGGDQIYADDVSTVHLHMLIDLGKELIGKTAGGEAREQLMVDNIRRKKAQPPATPPDFDHYDAPVTRASSPGTPEDFLLPADHAYFPAGRRFLLTTVESQMTTTDGTGHLFSLGEFAAMYLSVWSNTCWPLLVRPDPAKPAQLALASDAAVMNPIWLQRIPTYVGAPFTGKETRGAGDELSPFQSPLYSAYREPKPEDDTRSEQKKLDDFLEHLERIKKNIDGQRNLLTAFESGLAKVRRVLANIPTYMIFDDHDVTDDWNLNPAWIDRVYNTSLGVTMARNALVSYALFQDWGNDPVKYETGDYQKLLVAIEKLFPAGQNGPNLTAANDIDALFGFGVPGVAELDGSVSAVSPPIKWHFSVPGPKHLAIALDNRTRRSFLSRNGPPGNVAGSLDSSAVTPQTEQIPAGPFTDGKEVLLVIAPLQVLGPPILDELVAPAAYRAFDVKDYEAKLDPRLRFGSRGMLGTNPDAIEAWAFDPVTLEALLKRLEPYRQVVLLSGDVHYSASNVMSYFTRGKPDPARFVQFTSSGFKNVMPSYITVVDRSLAIAHKIVRARVGAERLGWNKKPASAMQLPPGKTAADIPRALRAKLKIEPVMVPTHGWPEGTTVNAASPPDWSWSVDPIFDVRADGARPAAIRPLALSDAAAVEAALTESNAPRAIEGYQALTARHQAALERLRNSRQILFRSNFGVVRFERSGGVLHAVHEMYTAARAPEDVGTAALVPELFVLHKAALATPGASRPENTL
jgi:hypothetical protein